MDYAPNVGEILHMVAVSVLSRARWRQSGVRIGYYAREQLDVRRSAEGDLLLSFSLFRAHKRVAVRFRFDRERLLASGPQRGGQELTDAFVECLEKHALLLLELDRGFRIGTKNALRLRSVHEYERAHDGMTPPLLGRHDGERHVRALPGTRRSWLTSR